MTEIAFDLKWAQTLDGQLCDDSGCSQWITGEAELKKTHEIRRRSDAVLVGAGTFLADFCQLTVRSFPLAEGELQPLRIIIDGKGRLASRLLEGDETVARALISGPRPSLVLGPQNPSGLELENVFFVPCDLDFRLSPESFRKNLLQALALGEAGTGRKLRRILVEGGPRLLTHFLACGLHDRVFVSIAPVLTGGRKHRIFLERDLAGKMRFETSGSAALGGDHFLQLKEIAR